jgi:uncharacterized protein YbjT (DUF2867 family)
MGVEVLQGDWTNVTDLKRLLKQSTFVFVATLSQPDPAVEVQQAAEIAKLIRELQQHPRLVVYSGGCRTGIKILDAKAEAEVHFRYAFNSTRIKTVFLHSSFFYENLFFKDDKPRVFVDESGHYVFGSPLPEHEAIPMISSSHVGVAAAELFCSPSRVQYQFSTFRLVSDVVSPARFIQAFSKVSGLSARYQEIEINPKDPLSPLISQMYSWFHEDAKKQRTESVQFVSQTRDIFPGIHGLENWMREKGFKSIQGVLR